VDPTLNPTMVSVNEMNFQFHRDHIIQSHL